MLRLRDEPAERAAFGAASLRAAPTHSRERQAELMIVVLEKVTRALGAQAGRQMA